MPSAIGYPKDRAQKSQKAITAVADAQAKLKAGQQFRRSTREEIWTRAEEMYGGDQWRNEPLDPDSDQMVVNMVFSTVNTIVPYATGTDPNFVVEPLSGNATVLNATVQQALLNRLWRLQATRARESLSDAGWNAILYGDGYGYVSFSLENRRVRGGEAYEEVAEPWIDSVSPWDVWIDPAADGLYNARWAARRFLITRAELDGDDRYFNKGEANVTEVADVEHKDSTEFGSLPTDGSEQIELFEFYDMVHDRIIVFSEDSMYPLRWIEDITTMPLVQMGDWKIPKGPYHMGEVEQIEKLQLELNKTRSQMATHRRRDVAKVIVQKGALDDAARIALASPRVLEAVEVDTQGGPLSDVIQPLETKNLSADNYNMSAIVKEDIYEVTGLSEYVRGVSSQVRKTATEASIIEGASNTKTQHKLRMVEEAAQQLGTRLLSIVKEVFPQTDYNEWEMYLTGRDAERMMRGMVGQEVIDATEQGAPPEVIEQIKKTDTKTDVKFSPNEIFFEGDYEIKVEESSTELRNPILREQKAREMLTATVGMYEVLSQAGVPINLKRLYEMWLEAAGVTDIDAVFEQDASQIPPEMQALLAGAGGGGAGGPGAGGGVSPLPGGPNLGAARPPSDVPAAENSGLLGPALAAAG